MNPEKLASILDELRSGLKEIFGEQLDSLRLYGSQARGDAKPDSDIDVLVVLKDPFDYFEMIEKTGQLASNLSLENDTVISLAFVQRNDFLNRRTPFLINARRESIVL
jgi:predicted nucleotidyltransferase